MKYKELNQRIDDMKGEIIEGIRQSVSIYSVKSNPEPDAPFGKGPKDALENAIEQAEKLGLKAKNIDNMIGYAEIGEGDEMVAILGHLDVVPLGDGWSHDPLAAEIHDGIMYGRGVSDDKGPTIGSLYALKAIKDLGLEHGRRIRVIFGADEESGSSCVAHYIKSGEEIPVAGFTPDADFPIINAEKGMFSCVLRKKLDNNMNYRLKQLSGGTVKNVVMPNLKFEIETDLILNINGETHTGNVCCEIAGKSAHASTPEKGENALLKLADNLRNSSFEGDLKDFLDFMNNEINMETDGNTLGVFCEDSESGKLTLNIGVIDYDGESISFTVDSRVPVTFSPEDVMEGIRKKAEKYGITMESTNIVRPLFVPAESELIKKLSNVYEAQTGEKTSLIGIGGGTYAKSFPDMVAFGPSFPGEDHNIHQPNEHISVDSLMRGIKIFASAILELAN